jgi:hypothetical protein
VASSSLASRAADGAVWSGGGVLTGHGRLGTMQLQERGRAVASSVDAAGGEHRANVTSRKAINTVYAGTTTRRVNCYTSTRRRRCCDHVRFPSRSREPPLRSRQSVYRWRGRFFFEPWRGRISNRTDR